MKEVTFMLIGAVLTLTVMKCKAAATAAKLELELYKKANAE